MTKSKTMWFAAILAALGAIQASLGLFSELLSPRVYGLITMVVGVAVGVLRAITTKPLSDK